MEFITSKDYEPAVQEIKVQMLPYYEENELEWDDQNKLELYRQTDLFTIFEDKEIGFAMLYERDSQLFLAELHISEEFRNKGYGAKALKMAKEYAISSGYQSLAIEVFKNSPAYELYMRNGFLIESEQPYTYRLVAEFL